MESILTSIKKDLGIDKEYNVFDSDIIRHINSALMVLMQLGVGPSKGFRVTGESETWDRFLEGRTDLEAVKDYVFIKVKLVFDPPANSSTLEALKEQAKELEWRLNVQVETNNA